MSNYIVRQEFINKCYYLNYDKVQKLLQSGADYQAIPTKVSQQILIILDKNWLSCINLGKKTIKIMFKFLFLS